MKICAKRHNSRTFFSDLLGQRREKVYSYITSFSLSEEREKEGKVEKKGSAQRISLPLLVIGFFPYCWFSLLVVE